MYCINCGKEIKENDKFCTACGKAIINENNIIEKKNNIKTGKYKIFILIGIVTIIGIIAIVVREIYISNSLNEGKENFVNGNYNEAVENLENVIESGEKTPENYIMLATSYVEVGDLYQAKEILKEGYEKTQSEELINLSIWGPMSAAEIVFSMEVVPVVRQEYCFNGDEVKGYQYEKGLVRVEKTYYFDQNGTLMGMDLCDCQSYSFGGGNMKSLFPYDVSYMLDEYVHIIDFNYDNYDNYEKEGLVELSLNGMPYLNLSYENGLCKLVESADEDDASVLIFEYDDRNRVVSINSAIICDDKVELSNQIQCEIKYNEDDSYLFNLSDSWGRTYTIQHDKDGKELFGEIFYYTPRTWSVTWEGKKVKNVYENDELIYAFEYDNNGFLCVAKNYRSGLETLGITCDEDGRFTYIYYVDATGEEIKKYIEYDENGRLISEILEIVSIGNITFYDYEYTEDGILLSVISKNGGYSSAVEFEYDEIGRKIESRFVELLYIPGTYTGTAEGWTENIVVEVTVDKANILSIEVVEHGETVGVGTKAFEPIIESVINANNTDVDTVSGSTITSQSLLNAINNALEQAKITNN